MQLALLVFSLSLLFCVLADSAPFKQGFMGSDKANAVLGYVPHNECPFAPGFLGSDLVNAEFRRRQRKQAMHHCFDPMRESQDGLATRCNAPTVCDGTVIETAVVPCSTVSVLPESFDAPCTVGILGSIYRGSLRLVLAGCDDDTGCPTSDMCSGDNGHGGLCRNVSVSGDSGCPEAGRHGGGCQGPGSQLALLMQPECDDGGGCGMCPHTEHHDLATVTVTVSEGVGTVLPSDIRADAALHVSDAIYQGYIYLHARGAYGATVDPGSYYETVFNA